MEKNKILAHIDFLTAEQLFDEIAHGNITLDELIQSGSDNFASKRKRIREMMDQRAAKDDEYWERCKYGNESLLSDYISNYRDGKHVAEAKEKIQNLERARREATAAKHRIIGNIRENQNFYHASEILGYIQNGSITEDDLVGCHIPKHIIQSLHNIRTPQLVLGQSPESIPDGYTEVYFWGIPGSGKTTALSAILSTASKAGYLSFASGPGYNYMTQLKNMFIDGRSFMPAPSKVDQTQYLPFSLKKPSESSGRSISLIELSGEIFECFYFYNANIEFPTETHKNTFNLLNKFLTSSNRKIHFFFIDYGKGNKQDDRGYVQSDYLDAASLYFNNISNKIFGKSTDAVYIVLTKSDLMNCQMDERAANAKEYLTNDENGYKSFVNTLKDNCKKHSINSGKLTFEPFSLGNVYFQQICDFDSTTSHKIINILMDRVQPTKKSILDIFNK